MDPRFFERLKEQIRGEVLAGEPLSRHTTWRVGGAAELFLAPADRADLQRALELLVGAQVPWTVIGGGSNLLVRDGGIRGAVIYCGALRQVVWESDGRVRVEAGMSLMALVREAVRRGWAGLEELAGIPGHVGGAVAMNAGAAGQDLAGAVRSVTLAGAAGERNLDASQLEFGYRRALIPPGHLVAEAQLVLQPAEPQRLQQVMRSRLVERRKAQQVGGPNAGSVFKNPPGRSAWRLIDAAGLRGAAIGGAQVSERHANFIVNNGGATASDILALIDRVRRDVKRHSGIDLETEVRIVGEDSPGQAETLHSI